MKAFLASGWNNIREQLFQLLGKAVPASRGSFFSFSVEVLPSSECKLLLALDGSFSKLWEEALSVLGSSFSNFYMEAFPTSG